MSTPSAAQWEDLELSEEELSQIHSFATDPRDFSGGTHPPQLVRTINLLPRREHGLRGPEDLDGIAETILSRTREGIGDVFAHDDYAGYEHVPTEAWARAVTEHQTGIPYTAPERFYGEQKAVVQRLVTTGGYPLVGQGRHAVTTALCFYGWDGGPHGDIGAGDDPQAECARLGRGFRDVPQRLRDWSDTLWNDVPVGACLFWSAEKGTSHHIAMVLRKHPDDRSWQLWDAGTSFFDASRHAAVAQRARMLWESSWWDFIPKTVAAKMTFRGIAHIQGLSAVRRDLKPRGRARLLLQRRSDKGLLFRSPWIDMEAEGLPISWLLRGLRHAPFCDQVEATFCVSSPPGLVEHAPNGLPILDCTVDARGNARMAWRWEWKRGYHERDNPAIWEPEGAYRRA